MTPNTSHRYITTHDRPSGVAFFSTKIASSSPPVQETPFGQLELLYATSVNPCDLSVDADIGFYEECCAQQFPEDPRVPNGSGAFIVSLKPGAITPLHRTRTIDLDIVIEGEIVCVLDGGEERRLRPGDSIVQRGTMHMWKNITPNGGWAKMAVITQDVVQSAEGRETATPPRTTMDKPLKIIYGAESLSHVTDTEAARILRVALRGGVAEIDTAHLYANSEKMIGRLNGAKDFIIHTKAPGVFPGSMQKNKILASMAQSLEEMRVSQVETYFLHSPDSDTPLEETMETIQELFQAGKFKAFGLSNFSTAQVRELVDLAVSKAYVLPSVYQGNYNPVARHMEEELLPLLRQLKIKFYAYSPLAGGFLAKTASMIRGDSMGGRWDRNDAVGSMYHQLYNRPKLVEALEQWDVIATEAGTTRAELAYRWMLHHSSLQAELGDAIIVGSRRPEQLEETLRVCTRGPLDDNVLPMVQAIWELVKSEVSFPSPLFGRSPPIFSSLVLTYTLQAPKDNLQG